MSTIFSHKFKKGFLLGEEQLRRVLDIVTERTGKRISPCWEVRFRIEREDASERLTTDLTSLLKESNGKPKRIKKLVVTGSDPTATLERFSLTFEKSQSTTLTIESTNPDLAYLLFSDLKVYVQDEINKYRCKAPLLVALALILLLGSVSFFSGAKMTFDKRGSALQSEIKQAIESNNVEEKLNALLRQSLPQEREAEPTEVFIVVIAVAVFAFLIASRGFMPNLESRFLLGQEIQRFKKYQALETNLIWVIGIGFIVNLVAGMVLR